MGGQLCQSRIMSKTKQCLSFCHGRAACTFNTGPIIVSPATSSGIACVHSRYPTLRMGNECAQHFSGIIVFMHRSIVVQIPFDHNMFFGGSPILVEIGS